MKNTFIKLVILTSAIASMSVIANEHYNYSNLTVGASFLREDISTGDKVDSTGFVAAGSYKFENTPLIINAGYTYNSVDEGELISGADLYQHSYFAGAGVVISATDRLDIIPGIAIGSREVTMESGANKVQVDSTFYDAMVDVRFHLERGLWLTTGLTYQDYDENRLDSNKFFDVGAEYVVNDTWSLGIDFATSSGGRATTLFGKVFY